MKLLLNRKIAAEVTTWRGGIITVWEAGRHGDLRQDVVEVVANVFTQ